MYIPTLNEQEIRCRVAQIKDLPALPGALQRLLEIISDEVASPDELESVVRYDQALSARLLRIANSSYYGLRGDVRTVSKAVMIIGFDKVRSICLGALLLQLYSDKYRIDPAQRQFLWKHAFATARIASEIARKRPWMSVDKAYLLGLLHDIGRVVMASYLGDHYAAILNLARSRKLPLWNVESEYGLTHTEVGRWVAVRWALPELFQRVVAFHHQPERSPSFKSETTVIALANILANAREVPQFLDDPFTLSYCRDLFITDEEWKEYQERMDEIWPDVDGFWDLLR